MKVCWRVLCVATIGMILVHAWVRMSSDKAITHDAKENLAMGYNLAANGVLSVRGTWADQFEHAGSVTPKPSNYREPLPPAVLGLYLKGAEVFRGTHLPLKFLRAGPGARFVKLSNIFWAALVCIGVFLSINALTRSFSLAAVGALFVGMWWVDVDTLYTELPAAALLIFTSYFLMMATRTGRLWHYVGAGLSLGALILTKAIFLYVAAALIVFLALWTLWHWFRNADVRANVAGLLILVLSIVFIVGPWMARNYYYLGTTQVTQRGGLQLMIRAKKDQMTRTEYLGAFYVWAPPIMQGALGTLLGFSSEDVMKGGRLQRLIRSDSIKQWDDAATRAGKPEVAISYRKKAEAEFMRIVRELGEAGDSHPGIAADRKIKQHAIRMFLDHPFRHAAVTIPVLWRGAAFLLPLILLLGFALALRRIDLMTFAMPSLALVLLLALMTHNYPRFSEYVWPVVIIGLIFVVYHVSALLWCGRFSLSPAKLPPYPPRFDRR